MRFVGLGVLVVFVAMSLTSLAIAQIDEEIIYEHIPVATATYQSGQLEVTWDSQDFQILEAALYSDWVKLMDYVPGTSVQVVLNTSDKQLFVAGRAIRLETDEEIYFLTPLWDSSCPFTFPVNLFGCSMPGVLGCSVTNTTSCSNGQSLSVSCSGDAGTCQTGGSEGSSVSCSATTTTSMEVEIEGGGTETVTETKTVKKRKTCG